jgi:hypothetical protein
VVNDVDTEYWIKAIETELESMYSNQVWKIVGMRDDIKPIGCKWVYERKRVVDGKVETFEAMLVAKCFAQKDWINYEETFSLVAIHKSIRTLLTIVANLDYEVWQMDVKTTFLNGYLDEEIYMVQPYELMAKS